MFLTSVLVTAVCLMVGYVWFRRHPGSRLPPFPVRPIPIVGNLLSMKNDTRPLLKAWREQCGDIFSLYMGGNLVVVLNGYGLIKEALVKHGDSFSDRPPVVFDLATGLTGKGIVFASGSYWREQRAVSVAILRTFGMGTNILAEKILDEVNSFTNYMRSLQGKPTDIELKLYACMSNLICSILLGHRFEHEDKEFTKLLGALKTLIGDANNTSLVNFFPWLKHLPGDLFKAKAIGVKCKAMLDTLTEMTKSKQRHGGEVGDINNFVDAYIDEMRKHTEAGTPTYLDDESLYKVMMELFQTGTHTTSTTITWCILYLVVNPDVQEKVYLEISDQVGTERPPTMHDRNQLTYLNAVILETQRLASIAPLGVSHCCSAESSLKGYLIPKGTCILPNLDSVLHDTTMWGEDAMSFRPERFIDDNGKLEIPEEFIPFGIGRRACLGEALAKMELFLFLSSMIQKFKFLPADPRKPPSTDYIIGIVTSPVSYEVVAVERHMN